MDFAKCLIQNNPFYKQSCKIFEYVGHILSKIIIKHNVFNFPQITSHAMTSLYIQLK